MRAFSTVTRTLVAAAAVSIGIGGEVSRAEARDFFSSFFEALSGRLPARSSQSLGYGGPGDAQPRAAQPAYSGRSMAYCVRTCDGRYFPLSASNEQSRAATCSSLCPASETKVYYGSTIDHARSESGKPYSSLPNAFKYREQLVGGCTCNGKDTVGLASISIEQDKTIQRGDIVAGENGLIVATRPDRKRGGVASYTPAPRSIRERFERAHAMARD